MSGLVEGKVINRRDFAPGLTTLVVDAQVEPFIPGQFVNLALQIGGELIRRAYSLASVPGVPLEFYLAEVSGGALTPALFRLQPGDAVLVDPKPQGFFTLDWVPSAQELWMVATGTGLGPFMSILRSGEAFQRFERIVLVHGVRSTEQLGYATELVALASSQAGRLVRVPVVSREPEALDVLHGRVTTVLDSGELEAAAKTSLTADRSQVMLCGNPAMIDAMTECLGARGLKRHRVRKPGQITVERYWD